MVIFQTLSNLQFDFEIIHKINELKEIKKEQILELIDEVPRQVIFETASNLRDDKKVCISRPFYFKVQRRV